MAKLSWHDQGRLIMITTLKCRNNKRKLIFIILLGIMFLIISSYSQYGFQAINNWYYLNQQPCKIPDLNPWDISLSNYIKQTESKCPILPPLMFVDHKGYLNFNQTSARRYGIRTADLQCKYAVVQRNGDDDVIFEPEKAIVLPIFIPGRFYRVQCKHQTGIIAYDFVHMNAEYLESSFENIVTSEDNETYSIIFVGIDSASHSHVLRNLPLTYKYLTNELHMYDFKGYMKVGMNTFPNLCPLLTGKSESEFPFYLKLMKMDSLPLLWKEKEFRSHVTFFLEDRPEIALFNFIKRGFVDPPTSYYFRPMSLAMAKFTPVIVSPLPEVTSECYGNLHQYDIVLEFFRRFLEKFRNKLRFAFFWNNQLSHESYTSLWQGDRPLLEFFQFLKNRGHLNNSILIVLSDHGYRLGGLSTTYIGRLENNLPFLSIYVPESLKRRFPWIHSNLMENSNRLVTVYDIHKTVSDISKKRFVYKKDGPVNSQRTARNLFHPIPKERTCVDAGIEDNFCTCQENIELEPSHLKTALLGKHIVDNINNLLEKFNTSCHELKLTRVADARVIYRSQETDLSVWDTFKHFLYPPERDYTGRYTLTVETVPGFGLFEGVVVYEEFRDSADTFVKTSMNVIGKPSRINRYGNQSHCIDDKFLKQYCYCKI
ncbi:hypothetical protein ACJMK2_026587 [Sinanodonta woodiana]|uniref:DUF229 domain containing protein n=1 Tax=Sinanodonta woodiana TaxID=1069815 RepID=A0ABD3XNS6_SINWO